MNEPVRNETAENSEPDTNQQAEPAPASAEPTEQTGDPLPPEYDDAIAQLRGVADGQNQPTGDPAQRQPQGNQVNKSIYNIPVRLEIIGGAGKLPVSKLMALSPGEILHINKQVGQELEIQVNGSTIGRGELVVTDDHAGTLGFRITHIDQMD